MRLILDSALFDVQSEAEATALVDLFITVTRDPLHHALLTDPPYLHGAQNGQIDVWLDRRDPREASAFRRLLATGLFINAARPIGGGASDLMSPRRWHLEGSLTFRVERRTESDWSGRALMISDAAGLLREPIHLVLENERTELAFVCVLAGSTNGGTLRALVDEPGRITVHGGGGGEAKKWIEALAESPPTSAIWRRMLRTWVLFDKDAGDPDVCTPSSSAIVLLALCERVVSVHGPGLTWVCLCRREIESYVPNSGLLEESLPVHAPLVQQVISWRSDSLLASHAWAFDLKNGLRGDLRADLPQATRKALKDGTIPLAAHMLKPPFASLSPGDIISLDCGLTERLGKALRTTPARAWTSDFPAEYDRGPTDQAPRDLFVQSLFDRM